MKWYKRDPAAALEGMIGLTAEERGYYNTVIDLLYARDGKDVTDTLVVKAMACNPRSWRAAKKRLLAKGKIREIDGKLAANRVESALNEARMFAERQANRARKRWENIPESSKNNKLGNAAIPSQPQPQPQPQKSSTRKKPSIPLPPNWRPLNRLAAEEEYELVRFTNHALAHDRRCVDWERAWANWLSSPFRRESPKPKLPDGIL